MKTASPLKTALAAMAKNPLITVLNQGLAHMLDLKLQAKQAHWNLQGENFIAVHELFDKVAAAADDYADMLAERVRQLDGMAQGTLQSIVNTSTLQPYPTDITSSQQHIAALETAMAKVADYIRNLINTAEAENDAVTADICTEVTRGLDKLHWLVASHADSR